LRITEAGFQWGLNKLGQQLAARKEYSKPIGKDLK